MRRRYYTPIDRDALKRAFAKLRKVGFIARMNFSCCNGCAASEIGGDPKNAGKPCVYYNRQAEEGAWGDRPGCLWLQHGTVNYYDHAAKTESHPREEERDKVVAKTIIAALVAEGLTVEWDGDLDQCILVKPHDMAEVDAYNALVDADDEQRRLVQRLEWNVSPETREKMFADRRRGMQGGELQPV